MKKSDLKPGDVIEVRNGNLYLFFGGEEGVMVGVSANANRMDCEEYYENLLHIRNANYDVVGVYRDDVNGFFLKTLMEDPGKRIKVCAKVYERKIPASKKMTVAEISEALGYDIEIIKG